MLGEAGAKELSTLEASGATHAELKARTETLVAGVSDESKRAKAGEYREACVKVFTAKTSDAAASLRRLRRDSAHNHELESKLRGEWSWLSEAQKDELRALKSGGSAAAGSNEALLTKVFEFFKTADNKQSAEDGLQTSCGGAVLTILGAEKAEELKKYMASGATPQDYETKVKQLLNEAASSGSGPKILTKNQQSCKHVFTNAADTHTHHDRRRRHDHEHHSASGGGSLEHHLTAHLAWLTDGQKEALRKLKTEGKGDDVIQAEVCV